MRKLFEKYSVRFTERKEALVEYALLLVLIALIVIVFLKGIGQNVNNVFSKINSGLK